MNCLGCVECLSVLQLDGQYRHMSELAGHLTHELVVLLGSSRTIMESCHDPNRTVSFATAFVWHWG